VEAASDQALGVLRPALELALGVARRGATATPAVVPPRGLGPVLRHAKLSARALATVRQVVDDDDAFRARVVAEAREEELGPVPYGWLRRRDGWDDDLERAVAAGAAAAEAAAEERAERQARRRLEAVEARRAEAEAEAARSQEAAEEAEAQLSAARQQRRAAEEENRALTASLQSLTDTIGQLERALGDASRARRELEELLDDAHHRIDAVVVERDQARARAERAETATRGARERLGERDLDDARLRRGLGRAVDDAASAARAMGEALAAAAEVLGGALTDPAPAAAAAPGGTAVGAGAATSGSGTGPTAAAAASPRGQAGDGGGDRAVRRVRGSARRPVALPPAVFDDSADAAAFLFSVPGMVVAVDGYNVSLSGWPDDALARQRQVLLDRLAALRSRTGSDIRVFFDGAEDHELPPPRGRARDSVRVSFSAAGTDADEDIIAFVDGLPVEQAVTVATSDRRVALEVAGRGANVISSAQLLVALGREPAR
jgi:predicted RNA-binding protein with PIN domain